MRLAFLYPFCEKFPFEYKRWSAIAAAQNIDIDYPDFGSMTPEERMTGLAKAERLIEDADAFVLETRLFFESRPDLEQRFHDRIESGARAFIIPKGGDEGSLQWWNRLLSRYEITETWVQIVGPSDERVDVRFSRDDDCFRDPLLFAGVDSVSMDGPYALWYGGASWPVLVGSPLHWSVDDETDLPADWNGRELACMAVWYGPKGAVLVASGNSFFTDPCVDLFGQNRAGIDNNLTLSRNVLKFLSEGPKKDTPEDRCKRIEINLVDFVLNVLKSSSQNWWTDFVPLTIRQTCAQRQEEEDGRFLKEAYLDLISLKTMMQKNWKLFEDHFRTVKLDGGKDKTLGWLDQLNELRRLIGHPLKKHVSGYTFSKTECDFLAEYDGLTQTLAKRVRKSADLQS